MIIKISLKSALGREGYIHNSSLLFFTKFRSSARPRLKSSMCQLVTLSKTNGFSRYFLIYKSLALATSRFTQRVCKGTFIWYDDACHIWIRLCKFLQPLGKLRNRWLLPRTAHDSWRLRLENVFRQHRGKVSAPVRKARPSLQLSVEQTRLFPAGTGLCAARAMRQSTLHRGWCTTALNFNLMHVKMP